MGRPAKPVAAPLDVVPARLGKGGGQDGAAAASEHKPERSDELGSQTPLHVDTHWAHGVVIETVLKFAPVA